MANCLKLQWPPLQFCGLTCLPRMMAHDDSFNFLCPQSHNAESPRPSVQKASQPCVPCDKDPAGFAERRSTRRPPGHVSLIGAHQPSQSDSALMGPCKDQPLLLDSCSDSQSTRLWSQSTRPCHEGAAAHATGSRDSMPTTVAQSVITNTPCKSTNPRLWWDCVTTKWPEAFGQGLPAHALLAPAVDVEPATQPGRAPAAVVGGGPVPTRQGTSGFLFVHQAN